MQEARIGNVMMRLVGYCSRCKVVTCNYDTFDRNPNLEPTETLAEYRKNEWGTLLITIQFDESLKLAAVCRI